MISSISLSLITPSNDRWILTSTPNRSLTLPPGFFGFLSRTECSENRSGSASKNGMWNVKPESPTPSTHVAIGAMFSSPSVSVRERSCALA